ncbi:MAG TPA: DinB family protein [Gemmatimonadaceae bacterium]|nr:DinB family protein [Gemmatimonadaceae bacterium]
MRIADLLLPEFDSEMVTTRKILERVPDGPGKGEWKPGEKTFPLAHLAQLVARLPGWTTMVMGATEFDIAPKTGGKQFGYSIESTATLLAEFDRGVKDARDAIAKATDEDFQVPWHFKAGGQTMMTMPRYMMLRTMTLNHIVHHRAQLAFYLRLLGEKVPSMYGPTADDKPFSA